MDEDGFLYFTDRVGDTFRYSRELTVNPVSLEEIIHMQDWMTQVRLEFCFNRGSQSKSTKVHTDTVEFFKFESNGTSISFQFGVSNEMALNQNRICLHSSVKNNSSPH